MWTRIQNTVQNPNIRKHFTYLLEFDLPRLDFLDELLLLLVVVVEVLAMVTVPAVVSLARVPAPAPSITSSSSIPTQ